LSELAGHLEQGNLGMAPRLTAKCARPGV
jgi:hypothetical protein